MLVPDSPTPDQLEGEVVKDDLHLQSSSLGYSQEQLTLRSVLKINELTEVQRWGETIKWR